MRKLYSILILTASVVCAQQVKAQDGFNDLIKSSPADATKLIGAYSQSLFRGFGTGLNSGWNNTAKTKSLLHFDLRLAASAAFVPVSDQSFDVTKIGLSNHLTVDSKSTTSIAPTFGGKSGVALPVMRVNNDAGTKISEFTMPEAMSSVIPAPALQLTIGLVHNTDITIRTIPTINVSDDIGKVGMIGFGLKHNFVGSGLPSALPIDLALAVNYNRINYSKGLNVRPETGSQPAPGNTNTNFDGQEISASVSGVNVQAIVSKKLAVFTPFLAVGYQTAKTNMDVKGNYPIQSTIVGAGTFYTTVSNPVSINETSVSGMRADIGFQLDLTFFKIYASGAVGKYPSVNGGIGFGF